MCQLLQEQTLAEVPCRESLQGWAMAALQARARATQEVGGAVWEKAIVRQGDPLKSTHHPCSSLAEPHRALGQASCTSAGNEPGPEMGFLLLALSVHSSVQEMPSFLALGGVNAWAQSCNGQDTRGHSGDASSGLHSDVLGDLSPHPSVPPCRMTIIPPPPLGALRAMEERGREVLSICSSLLHWMTNVLLWMVLAGTSH
ncbi:hypothetical protein KIL84_021746 [Mauremys mutica]|uniref:Uncharacterized protein n=1 Tax=Mauremys mutica TaxID=74926 RepID=A0A9D3XFX8_9SAUR|nr:hypothetical protein KIL84_021746 [Mauremys mutica]